MKQINDKSSFLTSVENQLVKEENNFSGRKESADNFSENIGIQIKDQLYTKQKTVAVDHNNYFLK